MKFRIVPHQREFKIQKKNYILWRDIEQPFGPNASLPMYFESIELAKGWIYRNYGIDAKIELN